MNEHPEEMRTRSSVARFLRPFSGEASWPPPLWLMRQAGRYLPEYREIRAKAGSFLDLCYNPELAAEVTLQPVRRFGFDAAILFSDILVVADALGQKVSFAAGEGPQLEPLRSAADLARLDPARTEAKFACVYETAARVRAALSPDTTLIGFCGGPWTAATYMVEGAASADQEAARRFAYQDPQGFGALIELLTECSITYLSGQITAGAEAVQIFDSWAGVLSEDQFRAWVTAPTARIVAALAVHHPSVPVIGFPRGAGLNILAYAAETGVAGLGCGTALPMPVLRRLLAAQGGLERRAPVLQGNLDPLLLRTGGAPLVARVEAILKAMEGTPFIFNLGHGILPDTPLEHVALLVKTVRAALR